MHFTHECIFYTDSLVSASVAISRSKTELDGLVIPCIGLVIVGEECAACQFIIIFHLFQKSYKTVVIPYVYLPIIRPRSLLNSMDLCVLTYLPRDLNVN